MSNVVVPLETAALVSPIKAVYEHMDALLEGIHQLKKAGVKDMIVLSPCPRHEIEEAVYEGEPSPVRWFTLFGTLFGAVMAFSLMTMTHANWPMILPGGKPVVSIPPFLVVTFEGTILWGSLLTFIGLMVMCRLPSFNLPKAVEDGRFTSDCFGIVIENIYAHDASKVKALLATSGATEVTGGEEEPASEHAEGHHA